MATRNAPAIVLALTFLADSSAHAALLTIFDQTLGIPPVFAPLDGFEGVPGQTMTYIGGANLQNAIVDCAALAGDCTQSTGQPVAMATTSNGPGAFVSSVTGVAGRDQVALAGAVSCAGSCTATAGTQFASMLAADFQQLSIAGGFETPTEVLIDITYSLMSSFTDNSVGVTSDYSVGALSYVYVGDSTTYDPGEGVVIGPNGLPISDPTRMFMEFYSVAGAGIPVTTPATPDYGSSVVNATQTLSLFTDTAYWVALGGSLTTVLRQSGDYSGLDIAYSVFADPTFSVNTGWAAANPTLAAGLSIGRTYNGEPVSVPEPGTAMLLAAGLAALSLVRRRRSDAR